jgi:single-stranded-DNA-specific exonuclease
MHSRWLINRTNPEYVRYLSQSASISPVFSQVLINRGFKTAADINDFLYPGVMHFSDPYGLPSMRTAVERVKAALKSRERILVHGDYDTDGLTATAIMLRALRCIGLDVYYFVPDRMLHGYGFHNPGVDMAKKLGAKLIITVDCGITSLEAASYANKAGIDVIITDHHEPILSKEQRAKSKEEEGLSITPHPFKLPEAIAVVNPKLGNHSSRLFNLSGAGLAFKFAQALAQDGGLPFTSEDVLPLLDLAALGTLADVVPLTGENRSILKEGLKYIHDGSRPGIRALKEVSGLNGKEARAGRFAFTLVPRINAAGRLADARDVVKLLLSESVEESMGLSSWLDSLNRTRQQIEGEVYQEALERLRETDIAQAIVLAGEGWHQGVLGIVASRIAEEFYRPTFVFSLENGIAKGSARSIPSFDVCKGLAETGDLLLSFGGHKQAAGIKLNFSDLYEFEKAIKDIAQASLTASDLQPVLEIDANIRLDEVTHKLVQEFDLLEPFGCGNPEPLMGSKALEVVSPRIAGDKHLKMRLKKGPLSLDAIGFNMGGLLEELRESVVVDAVFTPAINDWNGGRYLQLILKAVRPSA